MTKDEEVTPTSSSTFMDARIPTFDGVDKTYSCEKWIEDIDDNGEIFGWTPVQKLIIARRSLRGTAELWFKSERTFKTYNDLKAAILKEFPEALNAKEVHEVMSARKKKKDESCYEYMLVMKELGSRGKLADYIAIQYIIEGIIDYEPNRSILYGVTTYSTLKEKLAMYETIKNKMTKRQEQPKKDENKAFRKRTRRCFKCGDDDHIADACIKGVKCYKCNAFGHIATRCTRREAAVLHSKGGAGGDARSSSWQQQRSMCVQMAANVIGGSDSDGAVGSDGERVHSEVQSASHDRSVNGAVSVSDRHCQCGAGAVLSVNKQLYGNKSVKFAEIGGVPVESLIDSGSDENLMSYDLFLELNVAIFDKESITFTGLGAFQVQSLGRVKCATKIDGNCFQMFFHVVPKDVMPYKIILGQPFLQNTTLIFDKGSVNFYPHFNVALVSDFQQPQIGRLPEELKCEVQDLVKQYKPQQHKEAPIEMQIILKDDIPVAQRPRRLAIKEQQEVEKQIGEWLTNGIIRPSVSEYASPLVLVIKKDGSTRVCIDYRKINEKMVKDVFPLPVIEDYIDRLLHAHVFSKLDFKDAFFHMKIKEECIKYTAFVTMSPSGQYEFLRAPYGLSICPNCFTRFVTIIFRELMAKEGIMIFIDDVIIPADCYEEGLRKLREVLKTASEYGLKINWKKCDLLVTKVEYLGYVIENNTIRPSPDKTAAVMKFPQPRNQKELQSFIGLASYFRKFIENFAMIAKPLTDMLKKDSNFCFGEMESNALQMLKQKLSEHPVLRIFDPARLTEIHTDASQVAYSAILLQQDPNDKSLHPVYYMSRKTSDAEKKYSSYELEALAIVEGVKKFRCYLLGIPFKIVTDCLAFEMTLKKKDLSTRVARWVLLLQEYDYTIEHRAGTIMRHVDALSRNPCVAVIIRGVHEQIIQAQKLDEKLQAIIEILKKNPYLDYYEQNGLLYKGEHGKIVIPNMMDYGIIRRIHENGHFGRKKMTELLNKDYYIKNVSKKIEEVILSCIPYILAMRKGGKQEGFLNSIIKEDISLGTIHCDHIGPLTETKKLYNYILTVVDAFTKFVWLFPTKSTTARETIDKLRIHQQTFGNPSRIITDKGSAFTSNEFAEFCKDENITHVTITTGVPRGNGQVGRIHRILISVLTKMCIEDERMWYKHVSKVQRCINCTYQRSIGTSPFELLVGTKMKQKEDVKIVQLLQEECVEEFTKNREDLRAVAKVQILKIQEENRRTYNKKRKESNKYGRGDLVAIKRTQFGPCLKLKPNYFGPYRVTKVKPKDRYNVEKVDSATEGPNVTTTCAEYMKRWAVIPDYY